VIKGYVLAQHEIRSPSIRQGAGYLCRRGGGGGENLRISWYSVLWYTNLSMFRASLTVSGGIKPVIVSLHIDSIGSAGWGH